MKYDYGSPVYFREAFKRVQREWCPRLPIPERVVCFTLLDRTLAWGRQWVYISARQLVEETKLSNDAAFRALHGLLEKQLIKRLAGTRKGFQYSLNLDITGDMLKVSKKSDGVPRVTKSLKLSKRLFRETEHDCSARRNTTVPGNGTEERNTRERNFKERKPSTATGVTVRQKLRNLEQSERDKKASRFDELKQADKLKMNEYAELWELAFRDEYGEACPPLSKTSAAILRSVDQKWNSRGVTHFRALLVWAVQEWRFLKSSAFAKYTRMPDLPVVTWFTKCIDTIDAAYRARDARAAESLLPSRDRHVLRLRREGMPLERAEELADEEAARRDEVDTLRRERQRNQATLLQISRQTMEAKRARLMGPANVPRVTKPTVNAYPDEL